MVSGVNFPSTPSAGNRSSLPENAVAQSVTVTVNHEWGGNGTKIPGNKYVTITHVIEPGLDPLKVWCKDKIETNNAPISDPGSDYLTDTTLNNDWIPPKGAAKGVKSNPVWASSFINPQPKTLSINTGSECQNIPAFILPRNRVPISWHIPVQHIGSGGKITGRSDNSLNNKSLRLGPGDSGAAVIDSRDGYIVATYAGDTVINNVKYDRFALAGYDTPHFMLIPSN